MGHSEERDKDKLMGKGKGKQKPLHKHKDRDENKDKKKNKEKEREEEKDKDTDKDKEKDKEKDKDKDKDKDKCCCDNDCLCKFLKHHKESDVTIRTKSGDIITGELKDVSYCCVKVVEPETMTPFLCERLIFIRCQDIESFSVDICDF